MADTKQTKTVGEHWAASELARRGWAPALTRDGLERTDILAVHTGDERRLIEVQVKSIRGDTPKSSWPLGEKSQQPPKHAHEWFVMVAIPDDVVKPLRGFVIPRTHVAAAWIGHQHWYTEPGIPSGKRNVGPDRSRVQIRTFERYEGRWDLLDASADEAPILLPPEYRGYALEGERVGLPAGHPWRENMPAPW